MKPFLCFYLLCLISSTQGNELFTFKHISSPLVYPLLKLNQDCPRALFLTGVHPHAGLGHTFTGLNMGVKAAIESESLVFIDKSLFQGTHGDLGQVPSTFGFQLLLKSHLEFEAWALAHKFQLTTFNNIVQFREHSYGCNSAFVLANLDYFGANGTWSAFAEDNLFFYGSLFFQPFFFYHNQRSPHSRECIEIGWHVRGGDVHQFLGDQNYARHLQENFRGWILRACFHLTLYYSNDASTSSFEAPPELKYFQPLFLHNTSYRINQPIHDDIVRLSFSDILILSESSFSNVAAMFARSSTIILSPKEKELPPDSNLRHYQSHSIIKVSTSGEFQSPLDRLLFETEMTSLLQHHLQIRGNS